MQDSFGSLHRNVLCRLFSDIRNVAFLSHVLKVLQLEIWNFPKVAKHICGNECNNALVEPVFEESSLASTHDMFGIVTGIEENDVTK